MTQSPDHEDNPFAQPGALKAAVAPVASKLQKNQDKAHEFEAGGIPFRCPVCQAELMLPRDVLGERVELTGNHEPQGDATSSEQGAHAEREREIAAARDSHPVSLYPSIKPRMSYILSGGEILKDPPNSDAGQSHSEGGSPSSTSLSE